MHTADLLTGWEIRPFSEADYPHWESVWNSVHEQWHRGAREMRIEDTICPEWMARKRWIAFSGEKPVAIWGWEQSFDGPGTTRYYLNWVSPEDQRFAEVIPHLEAEVSDLGATEINTWCSTLTPVLAQVFGDAGYQEIERAPATRVDVIDFDLEKWLPAIARVEAQNIRITNVAQLDEEGWDWRRPVYDSVEEMVADMPRNHAQPHSTFEEFVRYVALRTREERELMYVALDGENVVGYSRIAANESRPDTMSTGLSGVVRTHRRRGIVTALKVHGISVAKTRGVRYIYTDNDDRNPMYHLNLALGYRDAFAWVHFQKFLNTAA